MLWSTRRMSSSNRTTAKAFTFPVDVGSVHKSVLEARRQVVDFLRMQPMQQALQGRLSTKVALDNVDFLGDSVNTEMYRDGCSRCSGYSAPVP